MRNHFRGGFHIFGVLVFIILSGCDLTTESQQNTNEQVVQADQSEEQQVLPKNIPAEETIDGGEIVLISAGAFWMGTASETAEQIASIYSMNFRDELPQHEVELDAFYIDRYEVTNAQYLKFLNSDSPQVPDHEPRFWNHPNFNHPNQPVVGITWEEASAYAMWAGKRLPTEAEWEKAARWSETSSTKKGSLFYPWGDNFFEDRLNYDFKFDRPTLVTRYEEGRSRYGVFNMAGNVSEWVEDLYEPKFYTNSPRKNPANRVSGTEYVHRGGGWNDLYLKELNVRCARRLHDLPDTRSPSIGFRCAMDVKRSLTQ